MFGELAVETAVESVSRHVRSPGGMGLIVVNVLPEMIGRREGGSRIRT